jgi:hypothetical protein
VQRPFDWKRSGKYDWKAAFPLFVPQAAAPRNLSAATEEAAKAGSPEKGAKKK